METYSLNGFCFVSTLWLSYVVHKLKDAVQSVLAIVLFQLKFNILNTVEYIYAFMIHRHILKE